MKRKYEIAVLSKGAFARTVRIYAPKKADRAIIMHDGQNAFCDSEASFKKSWRVLDLLKAEGIKNTAVIGIDSTPTRDDDYMPFPTELEKYGLPVSGGKADIYADYIEQTVLPYLDKRFNFKYYGLLGSSAGALATLYIASRKNTKIKAYGMYSTPLFVCPKAHAEFLNSLKLNEDAFYHVYTGGSERTDEVPDPEICARVPQLFVDDAFTLVNSLRNGGAKNIILDMNNTSVHDETCWRAPAQKFFKAFSAL